MVHVGTRRYSYGMARDGPIVRGKAKTNKKKKKKVTSRRPELWFN